MKTTPILFYDGGCPLCSREIRHYRRLDQNNRINWLDISQDAKTLEKIGLDYEAGMRRIHAVDRHGVVVDGVDAFLVVWRELPGYRWLAKVVAFTPVKLVARPMYNLFAAWRYRRRCSGETCSSNPSI